jgi:cytochrome c553
MRYSAPGTVILLSLASLSCTTPPPPVQLDMREHFSRARGVHTAVAHGDLSLARESGRLLAEAEAAPDLPAGSELHMSAMRTAARSVARAPTLTEAAAGAAEIAQSCAGCHQSYRAGPAIEIAFQPAAGESVGAHMARHRWALDRLWEGIAGPSDASWAAGLTVLSEDPLDLAQLAEQGGSVGIAMGRRLHELGSEGRSSDSVRERARLFTEILQTCVECHEVAADAP